MLSAANRSQRSADRAQGPAAGRAGRRHRLLSRARRPSAAATTILDITALAGLRGVREEAAAYRIGALTTWSEVLTAPLPGAFDGLKRAAREIGGRQVQNAATLAGNICNASPAADGIPALLALEAEVELSAHDGMRRLPLASFVTGRPHAPSAVRTSS